MRDRKNPIDNGGLSWEDVARDSFGQTKKQIRIPIQAGKQNKTWVVEEHELDKDKRKHWVSEPSERAYKGNLVKAIETDGMTQYHCDGTYYEYHETCPHIESVNKVEGLAAI
jgi:hypothetical protein